MDENNIRKLRQVMQPGGIAQIMLEEKYQDNTGHSWSEAALVADVVNIMRLNTKQLGQIFDVDIHIKRMTEERAADLIESMAKDGQESLVEAFEELENQQDQIIEEAIGPDEYQNFLETKQKAAYSVPNELVGEDMDADPTPDPSPEKIPQDTPHEPPAMETVDMTDQPDPEDDEAETDEE